ncbi:S8 family serine peptidase [Micromonospora echinofusca]|uniref:S8 family serine peptidase n=1 Tax=Micromonospora echinofusca TaxID=47858 RepID=A0ABS3VJV4_MICEH|nr:S8 family serine peptidase [Micromonospora echinofusca]MBO4204787.1 S8 family serine peptidase [Micromonospora echinofusca]
MQRTELARLFFGPPDQPHPWATGCPISFDTWLELAKLGTNGSPARGRLIISVDEELGARSVLEAIREAADPPGSFVASGGFIAAHITLADLIVSVLPLTSLRVLAERAHNLLVQHRGAPRAVWPDLLVETGGLRGVARRRESADELMWFMDLLLGVTAEILPRSIRENANARGSAAFAQLQRLLEAASDPGRLVDELGVLDHPQFPITAVTPNRIAIGAVTRSRATIKADAAGRLFDVDCGDIGWAVLDSGIDARHSAFRDRAEGRPGWSRVRRAFDFIQLQDMLERHGLGGVIDWPQVLPMVEMEVPRPSSASRRKALPYRPPGNHHGTHVAGVLGANWPEEKLIGVCPTIRLYDFRVLDDRGKGDEFAIITAMQAIRHINEEAGRLVIAGANLSLTIPHDVAVGSCGWTPVCIEAERLVRSGVVVVVAAGNSGYAGASTRTTGGDHRSISISDPGNAEAVITVGSTHSRHPHRHGVSYFSGRGPTADGRTKPDLLAPGEHIEGPIPNEQIRTMNGTSQAAPHVSGAAAILMARNRELIGRPERIKQILCDTATDLGRERSFQGAGLVDVLRALQSV